MSEWQTVKLGEIADVFDGPHATPKKTTHGPWFLSISSLSSGRLDLSQSAHLSEEDYVIWTRRVTPREGDVLFSYETRLGEAAMMPAGLRACLGRRMGLLRPKIDRVNPRFLLYAYLSPVFQQQIRERTVHGATVDRIPISEMPSWEVRLPDGQTQERIASVLGGLDDKIALNDRISVTYESLLRVEFARLRVDDEPPLGGGGECVAVSDLVEVNPATPQPSRDREAAYVDMAALSTDTARIRGWMRRLPRAGARFVNGDALLARITPCLENGKAGYVDFLDDGEVGTGSTEFIVLRSRPGVPSHFAYFLTRSPRFREHAIRNMAGSSGRQRVSAGVLANFQLRKPDNAELAAFGDSAARAFALMKSLDEEVRYLRDLRDQLLPRLLAGEIRVREAEKTVETAT